MFNDSLGNNIRYGRVNATEQSLEQVSDMAQLSDFVAQLPEGLDTPGRTRSKTIWEKQPSPSRTCLKTPLVIFDEALRHWTVNLSRGS